MNLLVGRDYEDLSARAAGYIAGYIRTHPGALICLAAGDTPLGTFRELIRLQEEKQVDLGSVDYISLDEWVGLGQKDAGSCRQVMDEAFYLPAGIERSHLCLFDGLDPDLEGQCRGMGEWIVRHGRIGLTLLGVGMNGHIGFNEPNAPDLPGCFTVPLDDVTKRVSVKYFGVPRPVETGITVGWATLRQAESVCIIASGESKAEIIHNAFCEPKTPALPASLMQDHPNLTLLLDEAAAAKL